jgi:hypothetical protein
MHIVIVIAVLFGMVVVIDRLLRRAERRGLIYYRSGKRGDSGGGLLFAVEQIFEPAKRHVAEERITHRTSRFDVSAGDRPHIDLDAGTVHLPGPKDE